MRWIVMVAPVILSCAASVPAIRSIRDHYKGQQGHCKSNNCTARGERMDLGIRGRTAIVCASSQGLGLGCARALAEAGVSLVINGRNHARLEQAAEEIRQASGVQ